MHKRILWLVLLFAGIISFAQAQLTISPYSRYGLGQVFEANSTRNFSMGGLGIGLNDPATINRRNPASYGSLRLTTLDMSIEGGFQQLSTSDASTQSGSAGLNNLALAFPTNKNFGFVVGLAPYSRAGYDINYIDSLEIDGEQELFGTNYSADGGLNRVFLGVGAQFWNRLNVGLNLTYAFGNTNYHWTNDFVDANYATVNIDKKVLANGLIPRVGVQYSDRIRFKRKENQMKALENNGEYFLEQEERWQEEEAKQEEALEKVESRRPKVEAKQAGLEAEIKSLSDEIERLAENERENERAISKLQRKKSRLTRKNKRIGNKIYKPESKATKAIESAKLKQEKARESQELNQERIEELEAKIQENPEAKYIRKKDSVRYTVGAIFEPSLSLNGSQVTTFDNVAVLDTLTSTSDGSIVLPIMYGVGFSMGQPRKWIAGADFQMQNWSDFDYFGETNTLNSSILASVGGEWIPSYGSGKYFKRMAYRIGANYHSTYLTLNNNNITEMAVSFGLGFPLGRPDPSTGIFSRINLGLTAGMMGTTDAGLVQEQFIRLRIGVNLNDRWFIKRRFD